MKYVILKYIIIVKVKDFTLTIINNICDIINNSMLINCLILV
ncbi:hypothetical protein CLOSBL3_20307 [Clostridiaceae bacterium BL-3]|nr:hypothetical protein CLOSBL3_20307 [Clostridiaceae bacterium BL-3]